MLNKYKLHIILGICIIAFAGILFYSKDNPYFGALRVLTVPQGGTGASTFSAGECLVGNGAGAITTSACGAGSADGTFSTSSASWWVQGIKSPFTLAYLTASSSATSTFSGGIESGVAIGAPYFFATSTATSTFAGGIHIANGGFSFGTNTGLLISSSGDITQYAGATCTNQFVRSLSASGVATCATVGSADVSLANLTATDSTLTFSGTYTGATARTIGLNLGNANTWTGVQTFANASSTIMFGGNLAYFASTTIGRMNVGTLIGTSTMSFINGASLAVPNGSAPTVDAVGEIAVDTTTDQLIYFGGAKRVLVQDRYPVFGLSTSTTFTGTTTVYLAPATVAQTWNTIRCELDGGFIGVSVYDGTNRMNYFEASTTIGTVTLSTNNSFTLGESRRVDFGTTTATTKNISCSAIYSITAD